MLLSSACLDRFAWDCVLGCIALQADTLKVAPGIVTDDFAEKGCCLGARLLRWLESLPMAIRDGILSFMPGS